MVRKVLIILITIIVADACASTNVERILDDVESYIMEYPDSALSVLDSIDRSLLRTDRAKAHHALLHTMALDKNYIDVVDDSLALIAVNYYSWRGPQKYKARAYYYLGLAYYYRKDYRRAIVEFSKAEKVAEKCDSLYWGMTKSVQAHAYQATHNSTESLYCLLKACEIYTGISDFDKANSVKSKLVTVYSGLLRFEEAENLLIELLNTDGLNENTRRNALVSYAYLNVVRPENDIEMAIELYEQAMENSIKMLIQDYWAYAFALNVVGRKEESRRLVDDLLKIDTTTTASYWLYRIAKINGAYFAALSYLEDSNSKDNDLVAEALSQSLTLVQKDYYESQAELSELMLKHRTLTLISVLLIIILGIVFIVRYVKKQKEEKDKYIQYVDEISRNLDILQNEKDSLPVLRRKYIELYKSKFESLRLLCDKYLLYQGRTDLENKMYSQVVSMINDLRNDNQRKTELELMLDKDLDGIMTNIRSEIKMKEMDYTIYVYLVIGFDATSISRLLDVSVNVVYIRKSRIKAAIEGSAAAHKEQYLEMLA